MSEVNYLKRLQRLQCLASPNSEISLKAAQRNIYDVLFIYLALPTRAGSPQQHMPITVGPFCLTHPVNFPCGRKPEYPEETHDFRQSVDFYSFSHEDWVRVALRKFSLRLEPAASEVKGKCANHLATMS